MTKQEIEGANLLTSNGDCAAMAKQSLRVLCQYGISPDQVEDATKTYHLAIMQAEILAGYGDGSGLNEEEIDKLIFDLAILGGMSAI